MKKLDKMRLLKLLLVLLVLALVVVVGNIISRAVSLRTVRP